MNTISEQIIIKKSIIFNNIKKYIKTESKKSYFLIYDFFDSVF